MAFIETPRFPDDIALDGLDGGPAYRTNVVETFSGHEKRTVEWSEQRGRWDVASGIKTPEDFEAVRDMFRMARGRAHGFRFKDWSDFKSCAPSAARGFADQPIGTGTGSNRFFQLAKTYTSGAQSWTRAIVKPVGGTVRVALGGVEQLSGWTVDTTTGIVSFTTAPGSGVAVAAGFEFDVPVRFDSDSMDVNLDIERLGSITSIPLMEIRR
jgi:uncharacterized protein (TIGR02217 family)